MTPRHDPKKGLNPSDLQFLKDAAEGRYIIAAGRDDLLEAGNKSALPGRVRQELQIADESSGGQHIEVDRPQ